MAAMESGLYTDERSDEAVVGEVRHSSAGNVYRLERIKGERRGVRRISNGTGGKLWDADVLWWWHASQWEAQLPLVGGSTAGYPHFGVFIP
jgi:hypothetical protein